MNIVLMVSIIVIFYIVKFFVYAYFAHCLNKTTNQTKSIYLISFYRLILGAFIGLAFVYIFGKPGRVPFSEPIDLIPFLFLQATLWTLILFIFYKGLFKSKQWIKWVLIGTILSLLVNIPLSLLGLSNLIGC